MILTFLDPKKVQFTKEFVNLVVICCFQIFDTKSFAVKSTIQATLRQLLSIILEEFNATVKEATPEQFTHIHEPSNKATIKLTSKDI